MFVFGTQYLRGASPERDQWENDLKNIKKCGFNTIRAWFVWNALEREEGKIDYEYISTFLNLATKYNLKVGILFHMHACPEWAVKKYSHCFYEDEKQIPFQPAVRPNTPGGGWPGLCFDHDEVRELERKFITAIINETKKYDCVAFYEPMNEPHQWIDTRTEIATMFCYCKASVNKFRKWLENKYGDIQSLNSAWGHFYTSFNEIRPPRWQTSYADYVDFRLFTIDNIQNEIQYRANIIRQLDTKPVIAHSWGGGAITCVNLGAMAFDDWKNAEVFDMWGFSAFPQTDNDCVALSLGALATRSAANGKDYWQAELSAGLNGTGLELNGRINNETFDAFNLESIRHGAKGLLYCQYRKERFGQEGGGFSLTTNDGSPTNLLEKATSLCQAVTKNQNYFLNGVHRDAEVGLVFSIRSYLTSWLSSNRINNKFAVDSITGYYKMLWEENIPTDVIHEDYYVNLSKYKVIIIPSPYALSTNFTSRLKEYVKNGGVIISDPFFGAFEQDLKLSYQIPGHGFKEVFGVNNFDLIQSKSVNVVHDGKINVIKGTKHFEYFNEVTATILYKTDNDLPVVTCNNYGKGKAIISATNLGLSYSSRTLVSDDIISNDTANSSEFAKKIVTDILYEAGVNKNICSASGVKVSVITASDKKSALLILINSGNEKVSGDIALNGEILNNSIEYGEINTNITNNKFNFTLNAKKSAIVKVTYNNL